MTGHEYNDAVSGAKARDLSAQVSNAVAQKVDYVTILIDANDLCTSSTSTMTCTTDFANLVNSALASLHQGLPKAHIFVASIPKYLSVVVHPAHELAGAVRVVDGAHLSVDAGFHEHRGAASASCVAQELAFNQILAQGCGQYANCHWDGNATHDYNFSTSQVSTLDYFHPSLSGQGALAN